MRERVPDVLIEQLYLDELPEELKNELLRQPEVQERLAAIAASNDEILARYPAEKMARSIRERGGFAASRRAGARATIVRVMQSKAMIPLLAAAIILLIVGIAPLLVRLPATHDNAAVRIKGMAPVLHVYRETPVGPEMLKNGAVVRARDLLQLSYLAAGETYGMILSVDGAGSVTLHYPETESSAPLLESGGEVTLPYSYELDNAPRFERFYFVTSEKSFSVREVMNSAKKAASAVIGSPPVLTLAPSFTVTTFTLYKGVHE